MSRVPLMTPSGIIAVTGAGGGMGLAVVAECARRGYRTLGLILDETQRAGLAQAVAGLPGRTDIQVLDITKPGDFTFPPDLEVLVNNAGIRLKNLPIEEIGLDEWRLYFEVNFLGAVELTRRAIPLLRARGGGVVCNINSGSITLPVPFIGPYRATKGAMMAFSESLRVELAPFGIRIVEIMPGGVITGINVESVTRRVAHAVDYPPYAPMAKRQRQMFLDSGIELIEASQAAIRIVEAILDDTGPMRYGTCAASDAGIEAWRPEGGEARMTMMIEALLEKTPQ